VYKQVLKKPDGRWLYLYGKSPISEDLKAPGPIASAAPPNPHLRWHPLRGEWVAYAGHRQNRTFLPPANYNPLAPTRDPMRPTELPAGNYDIAVFENLFPTLSEKAHDPPCTIVETRAGNGICEVVVFTQDPNTSLSALPLAQIDLLLEVWGDRYLELGARPEIQYVFPFENRGTEVGVTLHHPHGQIYAYPFVPPIPARELTQQGVYYREHHRSLLADLIQNELRDARRVIYDGDAAVAFVPACARYPYEVWIAPKQSRPDLSALNPGDRADLARALKVVLLKYDGLWSRPFPYVMALHQAPTDGLEYPEAHMHFELYPPYRMLDRLKYLAGSEIGAGVFTADTLPEEKAGELQAVQVDLNA
jgi:UDPglucose--hexose-1-phosphate uridylyltransferase